ncbi:MAG: methyltransferase [Bacteroidetes bacterium]|jgi:16S rRNA (guanine966-N2)-methyltransferase|nr:methyltransferase [Bacteroidota bacterium]
MRIITGLYRGRAIKTVDDLSVRPATERVRQTLFNMLANRVDFEGIAVLDLFAGSGSLGLEALSRGAGRVTFVEESEEAVGYIEENARALDCEDAVEILTMDAMSFLNARHGTYDLVFADPPYSFDKTGQIPGLLFGSGMIEPGGYLLIEHAKDLRFENTPLYVAGPEKKFGRTLVTFFHQPVNL